MNQSYYDEMSKGACAMAEKILHDEETLLQNKRLFEILWCLWYDDEPIAKQIKKNDNNNWFIRIQQQLVQTRKCIQARIVVCNQYMFFNESINAF